MTADALICNYSLDQVDLLFMSKVEQEKQVPLHQGEGVPVESFLHLLQQHHHMKEEAETHMTRQKTRSDVRHTQSQLM